MMSQILTGTKQICSFMGRSWRTVEKWIINDDFPAKKMNGIWESDAELITQWRQKRILQEPKPAGGAICQ